MPKNDSDRRVLRTRQLLQEALIALILEKGYEALTVQDVIDRANVGRSTFYAHFWDKEALLLSEFENLRDDFETHLSMIADDDLLGFSLVMFRHAQQYHALYQAVVGKQSGQLMQAHLNNFLSARIDQHLQQRPHPQQADSVPLAIITQHLTQSYLNLLIWWLDHHLPYPAERMDAIYRQLMQSTLESLNQ